MCCCNNKRSSKLEDLDAKLLAEVFILTFCIFSKYILTTILFCASWPPSPWRTSSPSSCWQLLLPSSPSACCLASTQPGLCLRQHLAAASPPQPIPPSPTYQYQSHAADTMLSVRCLQKKLDQLTCLLKRTKQPCADLPITCRLAWTPSRLSVADQQLPPVCWLPWSSASHLQTEVQAYYWFFNWSYLCHTLLLSFHFMVQL